MKSQSEETELVSVSQRTKPTREVPARRAWTEPAVWTERMLTALERGVKGGVWFSLIDKVYSLNNLRSAFTKVRKNKGAAGCDHQTIAMYAKDLESNLLKLSEQLRTGSYRPQKNQRISIPKPGSKEVRPLGIPTVRDRIVQTALRNVIEPIFEIDFAEHSYGFRPQRGCKDALRRIKSHLKQGYVHVVDVDLKSYFDSIPHQELKECIERKIADSRILKLIDSFLTQRVMDGLEEWDPIKGSPQGAVISPLLSNIYLDPLDHIMVQHGIEMVRYADDFVLMCRSKEEAVRAMALVQQWTAEVGLTMHPKKTRIVNAVQEGFEFLGYLFTGGRQWPSDKRKKIFREKIRRKTRRLNGYSLEVIISNVNRITRGWFEYFKHASSKIVFRTLDGWVRRRLRRILLKRHKKHDANGLGKAHYRWPNVYFARYGFFSMEDAYIRACQSVQR